MKKSEKDSIDFSFSVACADDVSDICEIEDMCFGSKWNEKLIAQEISNKNSCSFVCKKDGVVIGYVFFRFVFDEGEVLRICTRTEFRKMQIASRLMDMILNFAEEKKINKIFLEVRRSNISAISLYKKFGFINYAERKRYYPDNGEDAILMQKIFDNKESE